MHRLLVVCAIVALAAMSVGASTSKVLLRTVASDPTLSPVPAPSTGSASAAAPTSSAAPSPSSISSAPSTPVAASVSSVVSPTASSAAVTGSGSLSASTAATSASVSGSASSPSASVSSASSEGSASSSSASSKSSESSSAESSSSSSHESSSESGESSESSENSQPVCPQKKMIVPRNIEFNPLGPKPGMGCHMFTSDDPKEQEKKGFVTGYDNLPKKDDDMPDDHKLGLAPPMSVDPKDHKSGEDMAKTADSNHLKFVTDYSKNCAGPLCPMASAK